jgi:hypothetical protein
MLFRTGFLVSLMVALVGCATPAADTPSDDMTTPSATSTQPDETASPADSSPPAPSEDTGGGEDGEVHDAPELEAFFPEDIDGVSLTTASYRGAESVDVSDLDVEAAIAALERDLDDVSIATATLEGLGEELEIVIVQVEGASGDEMQAAFRPDLAGYEPYSFGALVGPASSGEHFVWAGDEIYVELTTTDRYFADVILSELPRPSDS